MSRKLAIIIDIDGTLADLRHRLHHIRKTPPDWKSFFNECEKDDYHTGAWNILGMGLLTAATAEALSEDDEFRIFLCSGRPSDNWGMTVRWLNGLLPAEAWDHITLLMRPEGDHRPDTTVKKEMLDSIRELGYRVEFAIDDRPSVVAMWRANGVPCFAADDSEWKKDTHHVFTEVEGKTLLTVMVGPSHAGKSSWLAKGLLGIKPRHIISSDDIREDLNNGEYKYDADENRRVFGVAHALIRTRMASGLPTVMDATSIRNRDRRALVELAPVGTRVRYVVLNRPLEEKLKDLRPGFPEKVVRLHEQVFQSNLKAILAGDDFPQVDVMDLRGKC